MMQQPQAYASSHSRMGHHGTGAWHGYSNGLPTNIVPGGSLELHGGGYVAYDEEEDMLPHAPGGASPRAMRPPVSDSVENRPFTSGGIFSQGRGGGTGAGLGIQAAGGGSWHTGTAAAEAHEQLHDAFVSEERRSVTFAPSPSELGPPSRHASARASSAQYSSPRFPSSLCPRSHPPALPTSLLFVG